MNGVRQESYGPPKLTYERTAKIWSGILDKDITPEQVVLCLIGMKLAREAHSHKRDNLVDLIGYVLVLEKVLASESIPIL